MPTKKLQQRVTECKNAALNDTAKPFNLAARKILEWEKTGDIRIMTKKKRPGKLP